MYVILAWTRWQSYSFLPYYSCSSFGGWNGLGMWLLLGWAELIIWTCRYWRFSCSSCCWFLVIMLQVCVVMYKPVWSLQGSYLGTRLVKVTHHSHVQCNSAVQALVVVLSFSSWIGSLRWCMICCIVSRFSTIDRLYMWWTYWRLFCRVLCLKYWTSVKGGELTCVFAEASILVKAHPVQYFG